MRLERFLNKVAGKLINYDILKDENADVDEKTGNARRGNKPN